MESGSDLKLYDVYLNFEVGSREFTACIKFGLDVVGIRATTDLEISRGESAIDHSRIAIVVFTETYAESIKCLNELTRIVALAESNSQMLLPVFYGVEPRDLKHQQGPFGKRFAASVRREDPATAQRWREALRAAGGIKGWMVPDRDIDGNLLRRIVRDVSSMLSIDKFHLPSGLVATESSQNSIRSLLDLNNDDVLMIGICGMGGIGKTTLAKAIYGEIAHSFEFHIFLADVREICKSTTGGLLDLQCKLLSNLLITEMNVRHLDEGMNLMKNRLGHKRTLLVIDDADHLSQLKALAGACNWFGPGSRIIITTRDRGILLAHDVKKLFEVPLLARSDAHRLFTATAFRNFTESQAEDYGNLVNNAVDCAAGLPIAILVLGSFLLGKSKIEWAKLSKRWKKILHRDLLHILRRSLDGLDSIEMDIFLDIACFFKGQPVNYVKSVIECCYGIPPIWIEALEDRFLISIKNDKVDMHEMLQWMGMEIVREEGSRYPHRYGRLWDPNDIQEVLTRNLGTYRVRGMKLEFDAPQEVSYSPDAFEGLVNLGVLMVRNVHTRNPINLPERVQWLEWPEYQWPSVPFQAGGSLLGLHMTKSNIQLLEDDLKPFRKLRYINFSYCPSLRIIPNLSSLTNLESLDVEGCKSLVEVHQSLGELTKLVHLNFLDCHNLHTFPISLHSAHIQDLILKGCSKLTKFPEIPVNIGSLKELSLNETGIDELPSSIENLTGLEEVYLENCKNLEILPSSIYRLQSLQRIFLAGCSELQEFPVYAHGSNESSAASITLAFPAMVNLELQSCGIQQIDFIKDFGCVSTLKKIDLSGSNLVAVPESINKFTLLQQLNLANCNQLCEIQGLPPNIKYLFAQGCKSLEWCVSLSSVLKSHSDESCGLKQIDFSGCDKLTQSRSSIVKFLSIEDLLGDSKIKILHPGSEIPMWFDYQRKEGSLSFSVESRLYQKVIGLAFCVVIGLAGKTTASFSCEFQVYINNQKIYDTAEFFHPLDSDHLWLVYVPCAGMVGWETQMQNMSNEFMVQFGLSRGKLKCCGVHMVLKKDETNESPDCGDTLE